MQIVYKYEKYIFSLLVLAHLYPVLAVQLFPTLDGPAHLYNSNLINQALADSKGLAASFFDLNIGIDPNYTGHAILCILNAFLPAWLAEKILLVLIIICMPLSFRMLVRSIEPDNRFSDYLVFPFIYSFTFYLGFYNFTIGIILMFFTLAWWNRMESKITWKSVTPLLLLFTALYYSHLFTFLLTGLIIGIQIVWNTFLRYNSEPGKSLMKKASLKASVVFAAALPGLSLTAIFLAQKGDEGTVSYLEGSELTQWLMVIRPLITLNFEDTEPYTRFIFYTLIAIIVYVIVQRIISRVAKRPDSFLIASFILLALYFTVPDWMASGGYVSMRLLLFFFMFLVLWLALQRLHLIVKSLAVIVFVGVSFCFLVYHRDQSKLLAADALEVYNLAGYVNERSVVLPVDHSGNWLHSNFSNYLGAEKKGVIVLDNYEADKPQFPLRWKKDKAPYNIVAADYGNNYHPCLDLPKYETVAGTSIDYILRWHFDPQSTDSCDISSDRLIRENYELLYSSPGGKAELFHKKRPVR